MQATLKYLNKKLRPITYKRLVELSSWLKRDKRPMLGDFVKKIFLHNKKHLISNLPVITDDMPKNEIICGDNHRLHNRIIGEDNFDKTVDMLKLKTSKKSKVIIGISRYNFFKINKIISFCLKNMYNNPSMKDSSINFDIFPTNNILSNFYAYIKQMQNISDNIELRLIDKELLAILETIDLNASLHPDKEKDLVRLLGVICEEAFIGPQIIVMDPFHKCNVNCLHCFVHNPLINHREGFLDLQFDFNKFKEVIDDAAQLKSDSVILQGDGEPLLHPRFLDMISYIRQKGLGALFFTNGSLLTEKIAKQLIDLEVAEIYCSLPAATSKSYEKICQNPEGRLFNVIIKNMKTLMDLKKEHKKSSPRLIMTHVLHKHNYNETIKMAKIDAYIGADAARLYLIRLDDHNKHLKLSNEQLEEIKRDLPVADNEFKKANIDFIDNIRFQLSNYENSTGAWSKNIFLEKGCPIGWYFCLIPAPGDISMCCHLRTVGYLNKQRFKEIWTSDYYKQKRHEAKFLSQNKDSQFLNGVKLYDEHCDHCDNHQNLLHTLNDLEQTGLSRFFK